MEPSVLFKQTEGACSLCVVSVLIHAACVHVLSLQTFPARQMNSYLTPYPWKHLPILPATYPCHVLLDLLYLLALAHRHIRFTHIHTVHLSLPTHSVCPPSQCTVIDELGPRLSEGKRPLSPFSVRLPKNSSHGQKKHSTRHSNGKPCTAAAIVV